MSLKIVDQSMSEGRILSRTSHRSQNHPGKKYITKLLDYFVVTRSNKMYDGLVMEVRGPQLRRSLQVVSRTRMDTDRARRISKQMALGLAHMRECNTALGSEYNPL